MNEYIIQKLQQGRIDKGLKQSDVAKEIGVKGNTISNYENGVSEPDIDTFCHLCDIYGLDPASILNEAFGYSVQGSDIKIKPSEIDFIEKFRTLDPPGKDHVSSVLDWECDRMNQLVSMKALEKRPVRILTYWGKIAAAGIAVDSFSTLAQGTIEVIDTSESRAADYAIGVNGNSMEPDYLNGDIVLVRKATTINSGQVGIFQKGNEIFIKECTDTGLRSRNPDYPDMIDDLEVICLGIVLGRAELVS